MMRPDSPSWTEAVAAGDAGELAIQALFTRAGFQCWRIREERGFDLFASARIEVKHDRRAAETGNVAIETEYRGRPSGIVTTAADLWAIVVGDEAVVLPVPALRELAMSSPEVRGGENRQSVLRLVPLEALKACKGARRLRMGAKP